MASPRNEFSQRVLDKAKTLTEIYQDPDREELYVVRGSTGSRYFVRVTKSYVTCTCMHGQTHVIPRCAHVAAVAERFHLDLPGDPPPVIELTDEDEGDDDQAR